MAAADGFFTSSGRFDTRTDDQASTELGAWINVTPEVTVEAGATSIVPFEIKVPTSAEPGDYAAGVTAAVTTVQSAQDGTSVGVDSRVGFRVSVTVKGSLDPSIRIDAVSSSYAQNWNPFGPGKVTVGISVTNTGNTRLAAKGRLTIADRTIQFPAEGETPQELLPGDTRQLSVQVGEVWPLVVVPLHVIAAPEVISHAAAPISVGEVATDSTIWALPLPQLGIVLGVLLLLGALVWDRVRTRRRLSRMLADARDEGRREALSADR